VTGLVAVRNFVEAGLSRLIQKVQQRCLATGAVEYNIRRERAMSRLYTLRVASLLACMVAAIEHPPAWRIASE
jgi:hypothetical protein